MKPAILFSLTLTLTLFISSHARPETDFNPIRLGIPLTNCDSWRLAVETNNAGYWRVVPADCLKYVAHYMTQESIPGAQAQYKSDLNTAVMYAGSHLNKLTPSTNGKDIWIFDYDQTLTDDTPYYSQPDVDFGAKKFNRTLYYAWLEEGKQPALAPVQELFNAVLKQGFKIVIISRSAEKYRELRETNLKNAGYGGWERLILLDESERGMTAKAYATKKRTELVEEGFKIVGNVGDQWSDLNGANSGDRKFKLPNPLYHVK